MTDLKGIKRFLLRAVFAAGGEPVADVALIQAAKDGIVPRPLESDIEQARNELESDGYLVGNDDAVDGRAWALTAKGELKAKQLK